MPVLSKKEAIERLARAVENATSDDLLQVFTELHPEKPLPDASGSNGAALAKALAAHIRQEIEPEEIVDLWNVVFPEDRNVYWDEEDEALRHNDRRLKFAGQ
jgi:hypothetical protein